MASTTAAGSNCRRVRMSSIPVRMLPFCQRIHSEGWTSPAQYSRAAHTMSCAAKQHTTYVSPCRGTTRSGPAQTELQLKVSKSSPGFNRIITLISYACPISHS